MRKALLLTAVMLGGCQSMPPLLPSTAEKQECESYGLHEGTPQYAECRIMLKQARSQAMFGAGMAVLQANQPYVVPAPQPSPFSSYTIDGRTYNCAQLGTSTTCQ